jgi:hypothetical protein
MKRRRRDREGGDSYAWNAGIDKGFGYGRLKAAAGFARAYGGGRLRADCGRRCARCTRRACSSTSWPRSSWRCDPHHHKPDAPFPPSYPVALRFRSRTASGRLGRGATAPAAAALGEHTRLPMAPPPSALFPQRSTRSRAPSSFPLESTRRKWKTKAGRGFKLARCRPTAAPCLTLPCRCLDGDLPSWV